MNDVDQQLALALCLLERDRPDGGTGKVPLLDPALVRKPCRFCAGSPTSGCLCNGSGWLPSDNEMDWVRATEKAGYSVKFSGQVYVKETRDFNTGFNPWTDGEGATLIQALAQVLRV